jgi:phage tail sheath protein FI
MSKVYATPGVYIEEKSAFPNSAVPVATAVPAFIGYTEKAMRGKQPLDNVPTRISSYNEFFQMFGGPPNWKYTLVADPTPAQYTLEPKDNNFLLHSCMRMFFANGGSDCYIVSIGKYEDGPVDGDKLIEGVDKLKKFPEPTMVVIPESVLAGNKYKATMEKMISHCGVDMRSRFAILDVANGNQVRTHAEDDVITKFREDVGDNHLQWAAAYYPWLETSIVATSALSYKNFDNIGDAGAVIELVEIPAEGDNPNTKAVADQKKAYEAADGASLIALLDLNLNMEFQEGLVGLDRAKEIKEEIKALATEAAKPNLNNTLHQTLLATSPAYKAVLGDLKKEINTLPPGATMAGIYSMIDNTIGVYQSPANVSVGSVVRPVVDLTDEEQEDLNLPLNGKAVNAIRVFPGKGTLVWGARTLDGNSQDWRYISVRRTVIFIEQSVKMAAEAYVFEPNVAATWTNLRALITNFLTNVWQSGALAGASAEDAFSVDVGLGSTMTPVDILDGIMRITVKIAVTRPAEFIVITFQQQMQKS